MEQAAAPQVKDELGEKVQKLFQDFLEELVCQKIEKNKPCKRGF